MEENKDLKQEEKKEAAKGTAKKTVTKKATTSGNTKKTATKRNVKKETSDTAKKVTSGTAKKTTTKKVTENPSVTKEKKVEVKAEQVKTEEVEKIEIPKKEEVKEEQPKTVEMKNEMQKPKFEPAKKVEKKKNHTGLKAILIMIVIVLVLFLINFARNYVIISKLTEKQKELAKNTNYSFITEHYFLDDINDKTIIEHYHKDEKDILIKNAENKVIVWSDNKTKEIIFLSPQELKATVQKDNKVGMIGNTMPINITKGGIQPEWSFMFFISSETVNGQDCYKIKLTMNETTIWVNKENGMIVKSINGYKIVDGKKHNSVTEWKNLKINELTDEDVAKPNLMGYEVTINEGNNQTNNNENNQENSEGNQAQENL